MTVICAKCDKSEQGSADALPPGWIAKVSTMSERTFPVCSECAGNDAKSSSESTGDSSADRLLLFIERIERIEEEITGAIGDRKDVYSEAKATGYDVKTMRKIVALRKMDKSSRQEADALLETYRAAIGLD